LDDDHKLLNSKSPIKETKNNVKAILNNQHKAMLIIDDSDGYYDQYTIYPLYEKISHKSATNLHQMLMIQDLLLHNREKDLDLLCFPDLYPFAANGQCQTRPIKLHNHEFIKYCLKSKHLQYKLI